VPLSSDDAPRPTLPARAIAFGPFNVEFASNDPTTVHRWNELFAGFPDADSNHGSLTVAIARSADGHLHSSIDGDPVADDPELAAHELALTRVLNHRKLDAEPGRVHFHAAAVARDGRAALLLGRSGDGKSTLTATLVRRGWEYATDEQVTLGDDDRFVVPYPRPLTLRRGVWHLFPGIGDDAGGDDYRRVETSLAELGGRAAFGPQEPAVIIAPRFQATASNTIEPFADAADVVQFLASCCHDLERTGIRGCAALVHLASTCTAHHLRFSDVDVAADLVHGAFVRAPQHAPIPYACVDTPADAPVIAGLLQRAPGSAAWLFADGSGIAFHPRTLQLARLDTLACALWEVLDTPDTVEELLADAPDDATRAALNTWIERLVDAGLLRVA